MMFFSSSAPHTIFPETGIPWYQRFVPSIQLLLCVLYNIPFEYGHVLMFTIFKFNLLLQAYTKYYVIFFTVVVVSNYTWR